MKDVAYDVTVVGECIADIVQDGSGDAFSIVGNWVWDAYLSPRFAFNNVNCVALAWEKCASNTRCRLIDFDEDVNLPSAFDLVDIPQTWQQAFEQVRLRSYLPNYAELLAETIPSDGRNQFILEMYGLQETFCGRRWNMVRDLESDVILQAVREKWPEYTAAFHMVVNFVFPQPNWLDITAIVLIAEFFLPGHDFDEHLAILIDDGQGVGDPLVDSGGRRPIYVGRQIYGSEILQQAGLTYACQPRGFRVCSLKISRNVVSHDELWISYRGAFVEIHQEGLSTIPAGDQSLIDGFEAFAGHLEAQQRRIQGDATLEMRTHGIGFGGDPLGMRRMYVDMEDVLNPRQIWLWIYDLWSDHVGTRDPTVFAAFPQPTQPVRGTLVVGHLLVNTGDIQHLHPVLCTLTASFQGDVMVHQIGLQAHLFPMMVDENEVFSRLGLASFVQDHASHIHVRRGFNELLDPAQQYEVTPAEHYYVHMTLGQFGSFMQMILAGFSGYTGTTRFGTSEDLPPIDHGSDPADDEEEDDMSLSQIWSTRGAGDEIDGVSLMQQPPVHSTTPPQTLIQLVGLHGASAVVNVDPDRPYMEQLPTIWPFTYRDAADVSELVQVSNPPAVPGVDETVQVDMYIMQYVDDHFEQVNVDDELMLTSIVFVAPSGWSHYKRKVAWVPVRASRGQILHFFRVQWFCQRLTVLCLLYVNGIEWPMLDVAIRVLEAGTHLYLRIRSDREDWCDVVHAEMIERNRRVFPSSDEEQEEEPSQEDEVEVGAEERAVSRSRSRSRSNEDGEDSEDSSLLQKSITTSELVPSERESGFVLSKGKPHVSDLWCAQPRSDKRELPHCGVGSFCSSSMRPILENSGLDVWRATSGPTIGDTMGKIGGVLMNEFVMVLYVALGCVFRMIRADVCRCRRRALRKVGGVRHQVRGRIRCMQSLIPMILVYVLLSQHCLIHANGLQTWLGMVATLVQMSITRPLADYPHLVTDLSKFLNWTSCYLIVMSMPDKLLMRTMRTSVLIMLWKSQIGLLPL